MDDKDRRIGIYIAALEQIRSAPLVRETSIQRYKRCVKIANAALTDAPPIIIPQRTHNDDCAGCGSPADALNALSRVKDVLESRATAAIRPSQAWKVERALAIVCQHLAE